jgi:hypothetical protein
MPTHGYEPTREGCHDRVREKLAAGVIKSRKATRDGSSLPLLRRYGEIEGELQLIVVRRLPPMDFGMALLAYRDQIARQLVEPPHIG